MNSQKYSKFLIWICLLETVSWYEKTFSKEKVNWNSEFYDNVHMLIETWLVCSDEKLLCYFEILKVFFYHLFFNARENYLSCIHFKWISLLTAQAVSMFFFVNCLQTFYLHFKWFRLVNLKSLYIICKGFKFIKDFLFFLLFPIFTLFYLSSSVKFSLIKCYLITKLLTQVFNNIRCIFYLLYAFSYHPIKMIKLILAKSQQKQTANSTNWICNICFLLEIFFKLNLF